VACGAQPASQPSINHDYEAAVTEAITVKAEYQYVRMGGLQAPVGTLSSIEASNLSTTNHVVKVGVNFHF
jgi:outer membrane immunogenic protein